MNFKVRVVKNDAINKDFVKWFGEVGTILKVVDGHLIDLDGYRWCNYGFIDVKSINTLFDGFNIKFEEVVELPIYIDHNYNIGERVVCCRLTKDNIEGLSLNGYYDIVGITHIDNTKLYSVRNASGKITHCIDLFKRPIALHSEEVELDSETMFDEIEKPSHYNQYRCEVIEIIEDATKNLKGLECVAIANVIKYILRYQFKNGVNDLKKAKRYLEMAIINITPEEERIPMMTHKQKVYIASLTTQLGLERSSLPKFISPIEDYHDLTEVEASKVIDRLLAIKEYDKYVDSYNE